MSEQRRLEFERRKKEIAEQQPKTTKSRPRRPTKDGTAAGCADGSDRVTKKRPKKPGMNSGTVGASIPTATAGLTAKTAERSAADYSLMAEQVLQQLQQLPTVTLQEPEVRINYAVWPMLGSSVFSGESRQLSTCCWRLCHVWSARHHTLSHCRWCMQCSVHPALIGFSALHH